MMPLPLPAALALLRVLLLQGALLKTSDDLELDGSAATAVRPGLEFVLDKVVCSSCYHPWVHTINSCQLLSHMSKLQQVIKQ